MKSISSRDNPGYRTLLKIAKNARASRLFGQTIIDGPHLVDEYLRCGRPPASMLVSESGCTRDEIQAILRSAPNVPQIQLRDSLFRQLTEVENPVGIAAVINIPTEIPACPSGNCVLLDAVQDSGNVGSILRTSAAAGIADIYLGPGCAGAWTPRVMRAAQGAHFRMRIRENVDLQAFLRGYSGISLTTVVDGGTSLFDLRVTGDLAWLFGNEGRGVTADLQKMATQNVSIPMAGNTESLNVAAAAAVCLFVAYGKVLASTTRKD